MNTTAPLMPVLDRIELRYSMRSDLDTSANPDNDVDCWHVEIVLDRPTDDPALEDGDGWHEQTIGHASVAVMNLRHSRDWVDACDAMSGDLQAWAVTLFGEPGAFQPVEALADRYELGCVDQVILFDHMYIDQAHRGQGIGPATVEAILHRLGTGTVLAALQPQPDGWQDMAKADYTAALRKVTKAWRSVGFRKFRGGVYVRTIG